MKKKLLKIQVGEAYDKDTKRSFPVYATAWRQDDGSYRLIQNIYVNEVDVPEKIEKQGKISTDA